MSGTTVRDVSLRIIAICDEVGDDLLRAEAELVGAVKELLSIPGLDTVNANPAWSTVDEAGPTAGWLYQDGDLRITRGRMPAGFSVPPHNHGGWNLFGVYDGAVKYRSYRRRDDGSQTYVADLEVCEDRVMRSGDVTVLPPPPHDVHTITGVAPISTTVLIARGAFSPLRERYFPDEGFYVHTHGDAPGEQRV